MHKHHFNKNRAPKIGSSAFFTSKREGHQHYAEQLYNPEHTNKYKRPSRAIRRRDKDRESIEFNFRLLIKNYDDLTKFKTFLTFMKKKPDIRNMNILDEELLTYNTFDITKADVELTCDLNSQYGLFMSSDYVIARIKSQLQIDIAFTNYRLNIKLKRLLWSEDRNIFMTRHGYFGLDNYISGLQDLTSNNELFTNNLKTVLQAINKNIKTPKYKTTPY